MLALRQGRVVDVDALVEGLWGEELPAAPRNALHHHIARLRAALGESSIVGSADGYAMSDAGVDAVRFEELLAETRGALRDGDVRGASDAIGSALALWRGPALQGLARTAWFGDEARRLEALRVDALEEQFEVALALGEHRELTPALRSALADNPFRERLWGQLMLALYRSGRQADALEAFQEARRVLGDELGLEPGLELRRLQEAILAHDPAIAAVPVDRRRRGNLPALSTSFVGREDELAQVAGLLREHRLVTLTGPPGVGKSRLALEAARSLEHEFRDGIWLVDLARAGDAEDAVRLLADAVDIRGSDPLARVTSRLGDAGALIVLDACEHVLDEAARIASALVAQCPAVRILATSREALRVASEARMPIAPLAFADEGTGAARSAAVELFLERARGGASRLRARRRGSGARGGGVPAGGRAAAGDRAGRRARERARVGGDRLHPRAPRGVPTRHAGDRPRPHRAARAGRMELRPPARGREDAAPAACRPPRRRVVGLARRGRRDATASARRPSRTSLLRLSTSRSCRRRSRAASPVTTCSTRCASTCSSVLPRAVGSPPLAPPTPTTSRPSPTTRGRTCAGRIGCAARAGWRSRTTISGPRSRTRGTRRTLASRFGSERWRGTSAWPGALPRDGASSISRWRRRAMTHRWSCGSSCSRASAIWRPRSSISTPRWRRASARSRSPRRPRLPGSWGSRS